MTGTITETVTAQTCTVLIEKLGEYYFLHFAFKKNGNFLSYFALKRSQFAYDGLISGVKIIHTASQHELPQYGCRRSDTRREAAAAWACEVTNLSVDRGA